MAEVMADASKRDFDGGFIVVWRKAWDSYLASMLRVDRDVALTCIKLANWAARDLAHASGDIRLERGQFVTSLANLARETPTDGLSETTVKQARGALRRLQVAGFLDCVVLNRTNGGHTERARGGHRNDDFGGTGLGTAGTLITVLNYSKYQPSSDTWAQGGAQQPDRGAHEANAGRAQIEYLGSAHAPSVSLPSGDPPQDHDVGLGAFQGAGVPWEDGPTGGSPGGAKRTKAPPMARLMAERWIGWFNEKFDRRFQVRASIVKDIRALLKSGYTFDDLQVVTVFKFREWSKGDGEMLSHHVPGTLLRPSNFDRYIDAALEDREKVRKA